MKRKCLSHIYVPDGRGHLPELVKPVHRRPPHAGETSRAPAWAAALRQRRRPRRGWPPVPGGGWRKPASPSTAPTAAPSTRCPRRRARLLAEAGRAVCSLRVTAELTVLAASHLHPTAPPSASAARRRRASLRSRRRFLDLI